MPSLEELQQLMRARLTDAGITVESGIAARREQDRAPLSFAQRLVWEHQQRVPGSTANNICLTFTYTGVVDVDALASALLAVVRRHEILRTTYHAGSRGDAPYQRIHDDMTPPITRLDVRTAADPEQQLRTLIATAAVEPFDLATEPSLRVILVHLPADPSGAARLAVVIAMQHIVWDGMTLPVIARDVERYYQAARRQPLVAPTVDPPSPQVADVAEWEQDRFAAADHRGDIEFWERQFSGDLPTTVLPYDRAPGGGGRAATAEAERSARIDRTLTEQAETRLRAVSTELRMPPFSVFLAAYYLALRRLTGRREMLIGTTVANREESGMDALVGNFSNSIALRIGGADTHATFGELVAHVRAVTDAAFDHRSYPYEHITAIARRVTGDPTAHPFDSLVLFLDQKIDGIHLPDTTMTWELADKGRVALPLTVEAFMHPDRTDVQISYQVALLDAATVETLHAHLDQILAQLSASGEYPTPVSVANG